MPVSLSDSALRYRELAKLVGVKKKHFAEWWAVFSTLPASDDFIYTLNNASWAKGYVDTARKEKVKEV